MKRSSSDNGRKTKNAKLGRMKQQNNQPPTDHRPPTTTTTEPTRTKQWGIEGKLQWEKNETTNTCTINMNSSERVRTLCKYSAETSVACAMSQVCAKFAAFTDPLPQRPSCSNCLARVANQEHRQASKPSTGFVKHNRATVAKEQFYSPLAHD